MNERSVKICMEKNRNEIIREERKQQIVDVALELFSKKGFHGVSVSAIAKACGMSKGLLYNYFESKDELLNFILKDYASDIYKELDLNNDGELSREEFEHFVRTIYLMVKANTKYYKLIFSLSFQEGIADQLHQIMSDLMPLNYELLHSYFVKIGRDDPEEELMMFASVLKGFILQLVMIPDFKELLPAYELQFDKMIERIIKDFT